MRPIGSPSLTLLMPSLPFVLAITIIGLPITVFLLLAPFLFLVFAGTTWAGPQLGGGRKGHGLGLVLTLAVLALPAALGNHLLERRAKALLADDHDDASPFTARTVAWRSDTAGAFGKDETRCGEFCLRALLTGAADRVLVVHEAPDVAIDPARSVDAFRMERRDACPPVKLRQGAGHDFNALFVRAHDPKAQRADERMQLAIAKGHCLIAERAPLGAADAVTSAGAVHKPPRAAWWNPLADTVQAQRITLHVKRADAFAEAYRRTGVVMRTLGPFYAPTAESGAEFRAWPTLYRHEERRNLAAPGNDRPDFGEFVSRRLGMRLELPAAAANAEMAQVLKDALGRAPAGQAIPLELGKNFLAGIQRRGAMTSEERDVAGRLLTDPRFPVPSSGPVAVRYAGDAPPTYFAAIGRSMFERLRRFADASRGDKFPAWYEEASNVARVIAVLPRSSLVVHRADLEWLAATPGRLRERADAALPRLADFGVEGGGTLLGLIDEAQPSQGNRGPGAAQLRERAVEGLCRLGAAGKELVPQLYARVDAGTEVLYGRHWESIIRTLTAMGETPDRMWEHLHSEDKRRSRERLDRAVERERKRPTCRL